MIYSYTISISGIRLRIETDKFLQVAEKFNPFLISSDSYDYSSKIECVENLRSIPKKEYYRSDCYRVYFDKKLGFVRGFFDSPIDMNDYCISYFDEEKKEVHIEYLRGRDRCLLGFESSFFHIGFERLLIQSNRLWIHGSIISTMYGGILFSGPSGIGKSTQSDLWCKYRGAKVINGDRPILSKSDNGWLAWGAPYAGSSRVYLNENCPVTAIVMLKQAKECTIRRLNEKEAFLSVWSGLTVYSWDSEFVSAASEMAIELIKEVPVYELSCTPDEKAIEILERALRKDLKL